MPSSRVPRKEQRLLQIVKDPTLFAEVMLGHQIWSRQNDILQSVANHARTAVKGCHASGKTFTAAEVVLWWITRQPASHCRHDGAHLDSSRAAALGRNSQGDEWREDQISPADGNFIASSRLDGTRLGCRRTKACNFQGFHGPVLIVLDEAPGVLPEIWEAIESIRAGGDVRVLALGNPTIASGPFYDAFTSNREGWNLITISRLRYPESCRHHTRATAPALRTGTGSESVSVPDHAALGEREVHRVGPRASTVGIARAGEFPFIGSLWADTARLGGAGETPGTDSIR